MKLPWYSLTAIHTLVACVLFADDAPKPLAENTDVAAALGVFDAWSDWTAKHRDQPAVSIGIVYDQELIWAKGYGYADLAKKTPATPKTAYRIASISKTFTAHALLQLRDAGKLQLDDPITKWLPELKISKIDPASPVITIAHLLTHTAGIPREVDGTYWNDMKFPERKAMLEVLARMGIVWEPEKDSKYSNVGLSLAGYIIEAASGEPYAEYMEKHVLTPLGMSATRVLPTPDMPTLAQGYGRFVPATPRRIEPFFNGVYMIPASNFASSVEDLAKYVALQFRRGPAGGAQILKGSTLAEMQRIHWLQPDWKSGWGWAWAINRVNDKTRVSHTGSVPGFRTSVSFVPADKFGVIVLTNSEDGRFSLYSNQAYAIVAPAVAKATAKPSAAPKLDPAWQKYVGVYTWEDDETHIAVIGGKLCMFDPSYDNPWDSRIALEPVSANVFRQADGDDKGETVTFILDDSGNVTRFEAPGYYMERRR